MLSLTNEIMRTSAPAVHQHVEVETRRMRQTSFLEARPRAVKQLFLRCAQRKAASEVILDTRRH
jgi:hypothetical protein